jgi:7-cyano-7-deazaguanine reductase
MFQNVTTLDDALKNRLLACLETFPCPFNAETSQSGIIRIVFPEFTCVCPRTGYPDFAKISIYYLPDVLCLELKSWKLYLNSFRMVGAFHEAVTSHLFETLKTLLSPQWLLIVGDFFPRGNVNTTVVFEMPAKRPPGADLLIDPVVPHCKGF